MLQRMAKFRFVEQFHGFEEALGSPSGGAGAIAPERAVCTIDIEPASIKGLFESENNELKGEETVL